MKKSICFFVFCVSGLFVCGCSQTNDELNTNPVTNNPSSIPGYSHKKPGMYIETNRSANPYQKY
jgi:hypothetical protein